MPSSHQCEFSLAGRGRQAGANLQNSLTEQAPLFAQIMKFVFFLYQCVASITLCCWSNKVLTTGNFVHRGVDSFEKMKCFGLLS